MDDLHHYRIIVPWPGCKDTGDWLPMATSGDLPASGQGTVDAYAMDGGCGAWMCCRRSIIGVYACAYMYIYLYIYIYKNFSSWATYVVGCVGSFVYPSFLCSYGAHVLGSRLACFAW